MTDVKPSRSVSEANRKLGELRQLRKIGEVERLNCYSLHGGEGLGVRLKKANRRLRELR
jgi:hypothetical protein